METKKILLVDDDVDFIKPISVMLSARGFICEMSNSGEQGFKDVLAFRPDLIVMDVNMETATAGFELNRKVRNNSSLYMIPIIMLTGIDTVSISNQVADMYRYMAVAEGIDKDAILKILHQDGSVAIDYKQEDGSKYLLPLDSFLSKPVEIGVLVDEINKFL